MFYGCKCWLQSPLRLYNVTFANSDFDMPDLLFSESFMSSSFQLRLAGCRHFHFHLLVWRQQKHWTVNFMTKLAIFSDQNIFWTKNRKLFFYRFNIATWSLDYLSSLVSTLVIKSVDRSFEGAYLRGLAVRLFIVLFCRRAGIFCGLFIVWPSWIERHLITVAFVEKSCGPRHTKALSLKVGSKKGTKLRFSSVFNHIYSFGNVAMLKSYPTFLKATQR